MKITFAAAASLAALACAMPVFAQEAPAKAEATRDGIGEIVVTA